MKQLNDFLTNDTAVVRKILNDLCGTLGDAAQMVCFAMTLCFNSNLPGVLDVKSRKDF